MRDLGSSIAEPQWIYLIGSKDWNRYKIETREPFSLHRYLFLAYTSRILLYHSDPFLPSLSLAAYRNTHR